MYLFIHLFVLFCFVFSKNIFLWCNMMILIICVFASHLSVCLYSICTVSHSLSVSVLSPFRLYFSDSFLFHIFFPSPSSIFLCSSSFLSFPLCSPPRSTCLLSINSAFYRGLFPFPFSLSFILPYVCSLFLLSLSSLSASSSMHLPFFIPPFPVSP